MTTIVHGTVSSLNPTAVCEDKDCAQYGELMGNHSVVHKGKGAPRNQKGTCPDCGGQFHNIHDKSLFISMGCLWQQVYGDDASKIPVTTAALDKVTTAIKKGEITAWASREKLQAVLDGAHIGTGTTATGTATSPKSPATVSSASVASPTPTPSVPAPSPSSPATAPETTTTTAPSAPAPVAAKVNGTQPMTAEMRAKLSAIWRGAAPRP